MYASWLARVEVQKVGGTQVSSFFHGAGRSKVFGGQRWLFAINLSNINTGGWGTVF